MAGARCFLGNGKGHGNLWNQISEGRSGRSAGPGAQEVDGRLCAPCVNIRGFLRAQGGVGKPSHWVSDKKSQKPLECAHISKEGLHSSYVLCEVHLCRKKVMVDQHCGVRITETRTSAGE